MSFLLDTDICSAYLKNEPVVVGRVMLHYGGLNVSVITVGELLTWALRSNAPPDRLRGIQDLLKGATVLDITWPIAERFGRIRAGLFDSGITVGELDLLNGATALVPRPDDGDTQYHRLLRHPGADHRRLDGSVM